MQFPTQHSTSNLLKVLRLRKWFDLTLIKAFFLALFLTRCLNEEQGNCRASVANCTMLCCVLCPQGAVGGLILGISLSFWVGVGGFIHPASPNSTHPLPLSTENCNLLNTTAAPVPQTVTLDTGYHILCLYYSTTTLRLQGKSSKLLNENRELIYLNCSHEFFRQKY